MNEDTLYNLYLGVFTLLRSNILFSRMEPSLLFSLLIHLHESVSGAAYKIRDKIKQTEHPWNEKHVLII